MPTLLIAYDLVDANTRGADIRAAVMRLGTRWARPLASLWYVETTVSAAAVQAHLASMLEIDDGLLVQEVMGDAAVTNVMLRWTSQQSVVESKPRSSQVIDWPARRSQRIKSENISAAA